ncbi:MAG: AAA family ATPase, partial [Rhodospirillales bacterium]|nr:AAA family ATPase [Rhodospirillales bacterium]
ELETLQQALEQTQAGHGQIAGVMGEPGVGKSRLFHEFKLAAQSGCLLLETFSVSHGKATAYLPVIELLRRYFQIDPRDSKLSIREKVTGKIFTLDHLLQDAAPPSSIYSMRFTTNIRFDHSSRCSTGSRPI